MLYSSWCGHLISSVCHMCIFRFPYFILVCRRVQYFIHLGFCSSCAIFCRSTFVHSLFVFNIYCPNVVRMLAGLRTWFLLTLVLVLFRTACTFLCCFLQITTLYFSVQLMHIFTIMSTINVVRCHSMFHCYIYANVYLIVSADLLYGIFSLFVGI